MKIVVGVGPGCFSHGMSAQIPESILTGEQKQLLKSFLDAKDDLTIGNRAGSTAPSCYIELWSGDQIAGSPTASRVYDNEGLMPEALRPLFAYEIMDTYKV